MSESLVRYVEALREELERRKARIAELEAELAATRKFLHEQEARHWVVPEWRDEYLRISKALDDIPRAHPTYEEWKARAEKAEAEVERWKTGWLEAEQAILKLDDRIDWWVLHAPGDLLADYYEWNRKHGMNPSGDTLGRKERE